MLKVVVKMDTLPFHQCLFQRNSNSMGITVYPKKYAHGSCFAVLCCGYTLTDFPITIRLTSLALWQSNNCPSASRATLMNMDKYFMWNHYERLHNHNKAKHNKTVCIFLGIYCTLQYNSPWLLWHRCKCLRIPGLYRCRGMRTDWKRWSDRFVVIWMKTKWSTPINSEGPCR